MGNLTESNIPELHRLWPNGIVRPSMAADTFGVLVGVFLLTVSIATVLWVDISQWNRFVVLGLGAVPVLGLLFLATSLPALVRAVRFRKSYLRVNPLPGVIGGEFHAELVLRGPVGNQTALNVRLLNDKVVSRKRPGESEMQIIEWSGVFEAAQHFSPAEILRAGSEIHIPINFSIPTDAYDPRESFNEEDLYTSYHWYVMVQSQDPNSPFDLRFPVPIYRMADNQGIDSHRRPQPAKSAELSSASTNRRIREVIHNGTIIFWAHAWPGIATVALLTLVFYVFSVLEVYLISLLSIRHWLSILIVGPLLIFIALFLLIIASIVVYACSEKEIWVADQSLHRRLRFLGFSWNEVIPLELIEGFEAVVGGSDLHGDFYKVSVRRKHPKRSDRSSRSDLVNNIPMMQEARWLAKHLNMLIGKDVANQSL